MTSRRSQESDDDKKSGGNYILSAIGCAILISVINAIDPSIIPISSTQVWTRHGTILEWVLAAKIALLWGSGATFCLGLFQQLSPEARRTHAGHAFLQGLAISVWAGVVEEVCFRWLIFLGGIATTMFVNWLMGGWFALGVIAFFAFCVGAMSKNGIVAVFFGLAVPILTYAMIGLPPHIPEYIYTNLMGPLVDFMSGGALHDTLFHPAGFAVGAALVSTNATFRDGHKYLGWFGYINSWFLGLFFFYMMLTYGLPAAILVHVLYDMAVFSSAAVVLAWKNDL